MEGFWWKGNSAFAVWDPSLNSSSAQYQPYLWKLAGIHAIHHNRTFEPELRWLHCKIPMSFVALN